MTRRGFTMLELSLAAALGGLVLLAALGVFSSLDRGDRVLAVRARQNMGLEMASGAIEKAIGTLVMEAGSPGGAGGKPGGKPEPEPDSAAGGAGATPGPAAGRARFILEVDRSSDLPGMADVIEPDAGTAGSARLAPGVLAPPQRLELVLARHPAPVEARTGNVVAVAEGPQGKDEADASPKAVRGAFELRPEARNPAQADGPTTWTMWWRPIERRMGEGGEVYAGVDALAVPLATGLVSARWSVFFEEVWTREHSTTEVLDLPAYVKLQVTTSAGLSADWLFEVGWTMGPEFAPPQGGEETEEVEGGAADVGGGTAATGTATTEVITPTRIGPGTRTAKPAPPARAPGRKSTTPQRPSGKPAGQPAGQPTGQPTGRPR